MNETAKSRLAAVVAVAATYVYFLLFTEFALLALFESQMDASKLQTVMFALGGGGIVGSLLTAWNRGQRAAWLRILFGACAAVALLACWRATAGWSGPWLWIVAGAAGLSTGALTVTLAVSLRSASKGNLGLVCGAGTGLAYGICNIPAIFSAAPLTQTMIACVAAVLGFVAVSGMSDDVVDVPLPRNPSRALVGWTLALLALVWMDSAAFFIIQHTPSLKTVSWMGDKQLWINGALHLVAAVASGYCLDRNWMRGVSLTGFAGLGLACTLISLFHASAGLAVLPYVFGVSFYSVLLVYWPAQDGRPWVAATLFASAGWLGSGLGIGMAQAKVSIPLWFTPASAGLLLLGLWIAKRPLRRSAPVMILAALISFGTDEARADAAAVARGREVYIAEGCIHCHSQYVRPGTLDEIRWGPASKQTEDLKQGTPPLYGNRRQGPDLAKVGNRRSAEWNRLHLIAPRSMTAGSRMPAYAYLFSGDSERGEELVEYLSSLGVDTIDEHWAVAAAWRPRESMNKVTPLSSDEGKHLFTQLCIGCHGVEGRGDGPLAAKLSLRPPDFARDPWRRVGPTQVLRPQVMRVLSFGLQGSPMAGHETLREEELVCLAEYVIGLHARKITRQ